MSKLTTEIIEGLDKDINLFFGDTDNLYVGENHHDCIDGVYMIAMTVRYNNELYGISYGYYLNENVGDTITLIMSEDGLQIYAIIDNHIFKDYNLEMGKSLIELLEKEVI